jgi:hypothetical protein
MSVKNVNSPYLLALPRINQLDSNFMCTVMFDYIYQFTAKYLEVCLAA